MSGKKLLWYLAVLFLVAGGYFASEWRHSRQQAQEKQEKLVFQVKPGEIRTLTLKSDKGEIRLERTAPGEQATAGDWRLTRPLNSRVDELTLNSLLSAVAELTRQRLLDEAAGDKLKDFGLDKPVFSVQFQVGEQSHELRFGAKAPGGQSIYAQRDAEPRVLLIRLSDKETLDRTLTALRHKGIFALNPAEVTEIRLVRDGNRLIFKKTGEQGWLPQDQTPTKLRADKMEALQRQLADAKAVEFVAEKADDLKKYGLAPAPLRVTWRSGTQEETLLLGGRQGDRYYAQVSGTAPVILVDKSFVENLPASYESLEDRRLWAGPESDVQKLVWGEPNQQMSAIRKDGGWELQPPEQPPPAEAGLKFNLVFWKLKDLEFTRLLPAGAQPGKAPVFLLQLFGAEDKPLFRLAEFPPEKDQTPVAYSLGEKTAMALVPAKALAEVKQALALLSAAGPKGQDQTPAAR